MMLPVDSRETSSVKAIYSSYEELLHTHRELLGCKNVCTKQRLIQIIKLDLDKLTHALLEVKENRALWVLNTFFARQPALLPSITARLANNYIYHLGFEIHEPLDLVLHGINHWIARTQRTFQSDLQIHKFLRFPASLAFQQRVGAYTEIMRIWIQVDGRALMLELFDMQRPVDAFLAGGAPKLTHRNFDCLLVRGSRAAGNQPRVAHLFNPDDIWHYAFYVRNAAAVLQLHTYLQALAAHDATYVLPYPTPVQNHGDGSLHTKIINLQSELEVEFVTQLI
jgi:hypothetical protein